MRFLHKMLRLLKSSRDDLSKLQAYSDHILNDVGISHADTEDPTSLKRAFEKRASENARKCGPG